MEYLIKLTIAQRRIHEAMLKGAVIGEFNTEKHSCAYEIFLKKLCHKPNSWNDMPFGVKKIKKTSFFALLTLGLIEQADLAKEMLPFSRNRWYKVVKGGE